MEHKLSLYTIVKREAIRTDQIFDWLNRMTDDEIEEYYDELYAELKRIGVKQEFPQWQSTLMSKDIDRDIVYRVIRNEIQIQKENADK